MFLVAFCRSHEVTQHQRTLIHSTLAVVWEVRRRSLCCILALTTLLPTSTNVMSAICMYRRLSWFLPQPLLLLYLKSYILPHFDYCDVVWIGCTKAESLRLESLLNFACRTVLHRCKLSSASAARCELGLSTLSSRRKFHLAQTVFKCLYSPCPTYLSHLFPTPNSSYHTRSSSSSQLNLPAVRSSYGQRAFSFAGASMWRSLPATTRQMRDFQAFSAKCKDLLI